MKKIVLLAVGVALATAVGAQQQWHYDSTKVEKLSEVVVKGIRAQKNAPYAISNLKKRELGDHAKTGRELPFLFAQTPGVMAWGENGLGTGTSHLRIRGASDSRINVTLDGVPLNSPEDQCVFWANMNSYGSLLGSVQIQRGVGTSTNGDGAFGGTVALQTATPSLTPSLELSASYGTYNTLNFGGNFSTGALPLGVARLIIDGAYHQTTTDGFLNGTSGRSGSYYGALTLIVSDDLVVRYKNLGNFERTGQAWNGVTAGNGDYSLMDGCYDDGSWTYQTKTGITSYDGLADVGLGKFNSLYEYLVTGDDGLFVRNADGTYQTERYKMADGSFWDKTTDNFWQNHNILSLAWNVNEHWTTSASLHYTYGYGYYEEFRQNNKLSKYGLQNFTGSNGKTVKRSDFVRKKGLRQDVFGLVGNANYTDDRWDIVAGLSAQQFYGQHFGYLTYVGNAELAQRLGGLYKYYDSGASKTDASVFAKAAYHLTSQWDAFADLQYRHVDFSTDGYNDKYYTDADGNLQKHILDINEHYDFLNPKAGLSYHTDGHHAYASVAMSHREPERNNFTDNGHRPYPKAEQLLDYELGYTYNADIWRAGVNLYYMDYKDQFVQTGEVSDIGENLTTNIKKSYRMGVELQAGVDPTSWLTIEGNAALSENRIKDFDEQVQVDWGDYQTIHYDNSTLAFSPAVLLNGFVNFHYRGLQAVWHTNYVGRQYLDNTECTDRSLPGYSTSNVTLSYTLPIKKVLREAVFGLNLNNVFDKRYAAGGWVYSAILSDGHPNENRYYQIGYMPMAGFTMMGNVTLRF